MKTTEKHAAFLFALLIPALLVGCKSYHPTLFEALSSPAETHDAGNPFVGVWEMNYPYNQNVRLIYIFTDDKRWASYTPRNRSSESGTYTYRGSVLHMSYINYSPLGGVIDSIMGEYTFSRITPLGTVIAILDGDKLKFARNGNTLRRVSADWQGYEVNPGTITVKFN